MGVQFTVQIANRPGELAHLARALAARGVNIEHIAGGGAGAIGYATLTTDDDAATHEVLRQTGYQFVEGEPIRVVLEDRPGALAELTERLGAAGVDIHGLMKCGSRGDTVELTVTVDDPSAARRVLGID
jgi:hypothetical protein